MCTLTLGDLAKGGTLTDSNGQSVELDAPHAYATGHVDIADATAAGTIVFGEHEAIEFEAQPAVAASALLDMKDSLPDGIEFALAIGGEDQNGFSADNSEGWTLDSLVSAINNADNWTHAPEVEASKADGKCLLTAKSEYPGSAGNSLEVIAFAHSPFTEPDTLLSGGVDARTQQEVVDTLNASEDCPAVAVLAHVEAQDAMAVFTPLDEYDDSMDYELGVYEDGVLVNEWAWSAQDGDTAQELVDALNDDSGQYWQNTRDIEAALEGGKVVLRRIGVHGAASNGYSVEPYAVTPFVETDEKPIAGGLDESYTISFTAKEYGVNDTIVVTGSLFGDEIGMSGGHGDYTVAELVTAISGEFSDITPAAGEAEGTITLTATTAGKAANAITYTATGCFGSGTTRQGSTTRGKDAVEQTDYKIYLNGEEFSGGGAPVAPVPEPLGTTTTLLHGHVYTLAVEAGTDLSALGVELYGTAELWIDYTAGSVTWPTLWSWVDGIVPTFTAGTRYFVRGWSDGVAVIAKLEYSYTNV